MWSCEVLYTGEGIPLQDVLTHKHSHQCQNWSELHALGTSHKLYRTPKLPHAHCQSHLCIVKHRQEDDKNRPRMWHPHFWGDIWLCRAVNTMLFMTSIIIKWQEDVVFHGPLWHAFLAICMRGHLKSEYQVCLIVLIWAKLLWTT